MLNGSKLKTLSILLISTAMAFSVSTAWSQTAINSAAQLSDNSEIKIDAKEKGAEVSCYGQKFTIDKLDLQEAQKRCAEIKKQAGQNITEAQRERDAAATPPPPAEKAA